MDYWERYGKYIQGKNENDRLDIIRDYHLNTFADINREYLREPDLTDIVGAPLAGTFKIVATHTDRFDLDEFISLQGPCAVYLERLVYSPEDRDVCVQVGFSDSCKLWINGDHLFTNTAPNWCTNENRHFTNIKFHQGVNRVVFKLARSSHKAMYSMIFSKGGACADHFLDFASEVNIHQGEFGALP